MSAPATGSGTGGEQFKCPNCSGELVYDATVQAMRCTYCRATVATAHLSTPGGAVHTAGVPTPHTAPIREIPISQGLTLAPRGFGTAVQSFQCKDCGATVNVGPNERTAKCTYCASSMVMPVALDANLITPESLIPFQIAKERATEQFKTWLKGLWFRPSNLHSMARLDQIAGVYVPFWTFDAWVRSQWTAQRGWFYWETEEYTTVENGETVVSTRQVQRTRWEPAWGNRQDFYDDVLVCGSRGLPEPMVEKFSSFNTQVLVPYAPAYLAGWRAESYAVDLPTAWTKGQSKIEQQQRGRCAGDVGGDTHADLSVTNEYANETFKHVLLPVYVAAYRYNNKPFRFLVNGQTGEVVGEAPLSVWKITMLVLLIVALIAGGVLLYLSQQEGGLGLRSVRHPSRVAAQIDSRGFDKARSRSASRSRIAQPARDRGARRAAGTPCSTTSASRERAYRDRT